MKTHEHHFQNYIQRLEKIRRLSTPSLDGIPDADEYSDRLRKNFIQIGDLAAENRDFLESVFFPMIQGDHHFSGEELRELSSFGSDLLSARDVENLDLPILSLLSERLLEDAKTNHDRADTIRQLDTRMDTCYGLMTMTGRVSAYPEISNRYRQEGLMIGEYFHSLLDREEFQKLDMESRHTVLTDSRYTAVFYEGVHSVYHDKNKEIAILDKMLQISEDPFYLNMAPDFDWVYFRYRTLNYYAKITDLGNIRAYPKDKLDAICERTEEFADLWYSDPDFFCEYDNEKQIRMLSKRNQFLAGRIPKEEYMDELAELYRMRDPDQYDLNGIYDNLQLPAEYISMLDPTHLTKTQAVYLQHIYENMVLYAFRMPNNGSLSSMLEYYICIIDRFIEVPGGMPFEEMVLQCLAALHPPTYIHSIMVASLAKCLCEHLIELRPQILVGTAGCTNTEDVLKNRDSICEFLYQASLCHDFGKLSIIDTIFVYGRKLLDMEFDMIRTHPSTGYLMLTRYESTRAYADAALGHHRWYDNSRGYPDTFHPQKSPIWTLICLVQCADCMDAATDSVGRSYSKGKTFDQFVEEIKEGSGTQYAPWLYDLLCDPATEKDLRRILKKGRSDTYRNTYHLLQQMQDRAKK